MKKQMISLFLATAMLLSLTSCGKKNTNYASMSLEEYIEAVELPKNLTISIDPATVEERETVKVYENVEYMNFDAETLKELLLRNPVTEENINAMGHQYAAKTDTQADYLSVYDGGEAWFGESGQSVDGGFTYFCRPDLQYEGGSVVDSLLEIHSQMYQLNDPTIPDRLLGLLDSADHTLDFAPREKAVEEILSFLTENGCPQAEVFATVAYDLETLTMRYEQEFTQDQIPPQKSDEVYAMFCRQLVDDIPVNAYQLSAGSDSPWLSGPNMLLYYSEKGIVSANSYCWVEQPQEANGTETEIISAVSALELAKEYYGKAILSKEYTIEELELTYVEFRSDDRKTVILRPYWLVKTGYQQHYVTTDLKGNPVEGDLKTYDFLYFDAVTGDLFEGSPSVE